MPKVKKARDPHHIPRPPNSFFLYRQERLPALQQEYAARGTPLLATELAKILGQEFRQLSTEMKARLEEKRLEVELQHQRDHPGWKFAPKKAQQAESKVVHPPKAKKGRGITKKAASTAGSSSQATGQPADGSPNCFYSTFYVQPPAYPNAQTPKGSASLAPQSRPRSTPVSASPAPPASERSDIHDLNTVAPIELPHSIQGTPLNVYPNVGFEGRGSVSSAGRPASSASSVSQSSLNSSSCASTADMSAILRVQSPASNFDSTSPASSAYQSRAPSQVLYQNSVPMDLPVVQQRPSHASGEYSIPQVSFHHPSGSHPHLTSSSSQYPVSTFNSMSSLHVAASQDNGASSNGEFYHFPVLWPGVESRAGLGRDEIVVPGVAPDAFELDFGSQPLENYDTQTMQDDLSILQNDFRALERWIQESNGESNEQHVEQAADLDVSIENVDTIPEEKQTEIDHSEVSVRDFSVLQSNDGQVLSSHTTDEAPVQRGSVRDLSEDASSSIDGSSDVVISPTTRISPEESGQLLYRTSECHLGFSYPNFFLEESPSSQSEDSYPELLLSQAADLDD
ncbi:hypothetical protein D9757_005015 [Collybiopsis confluens]|uniref:HMG box domain-containing protein n=1 Tax=Collybiopsis confluens TaxID=2823264 RepID=A0A8H5MCL0_9AGAR|nr:hypothetical protein D9757_014904 [Collybiopsis confluens]KAF5389032.1 hypothetical protein D9757_005015 [Collybiopsis confluens]